MLSSWIAWFRVVMRIWLAVNNSTSIAKQVKYNKGFNLFVKPHCSCPRIRSLFICYLVFINALKGKIWYVEIDPHEQTFL